MPEPTKIPRPFADSGDKNTIPESSGALGFASWQEGFPAITGTPFAQGGVAPKRADFNGIFNALSLATLWQQQGGFYAYDATTDYEVGNVVEYNNDLYKCLTANGPSSSVKAPTDTTVWSKVMTAADAAALYLPLSGGTLSGTLQFSPEIGLIRKTVDGGSLALLGGSTYGRGAEIVIYGKDSANDGSFSIRARNASNTRSLNGSTDGTLTWDGKNVETNISNTTAYYRLSNGLQILTGTGNSISSGPVHINFSHAFAATPRVVITGAGSSTTFFAPKVDNISATGFDLYDIGVNGYINNAFNVWLAFGVGA